MKKRFYMFFLVLCLPLPSLYGQYTLEECRRLAQEHYPLARQYGLIEKSKEYNLSNAAKGYLPQLNFSAKASYQSDVTEIPVKIPGMEIEGMRKDQYQAAVELNQEIWDGGSIRAREKGIRLQTRTDIRKLDVDMYALNERVDQLFFGILLQEAQLKQNELLCGELERNYRQVEAWTEYGIASLSDLDAVKAEQLGALQKRYELEASRKAYYRMLSALTGTEMDPEHPVICPAPLPGLSLQNAAVSVRRPELEWFEAQQAQLEAQEQMIRAKNHPALGLFVQGTYGNPGLNMLKNKFAPDYIAGVRVAWNFGNLYTRKNERRLIANTRQNIRVQRETFLFNTRLDITRQASEIEKMEKIMREDGQIIVLRENIKKAAQAGVAGGTLSVTEMLREVTAADRAMQDKALHQIQWLMAQYALRNLTNNNNE